eukprot:4919162-Alexandrium_andersonii.AAC.1
MHTGKYTHTDTRALPSDQRTSVQSPHTLCGLLARMRAALDAAQVLLIDGPCHGLQDGAVDLLVPLVALAPEQFHGRC